MPEAFGVHPSSLASFDCVQVSWTVGEHEEAPPPFADITGQNRQPSQPAASDDLFFAKSHVTSSSKTPVHSPPGDVAISSQHRQGVLSPAMAVSPLPTGHAHSSPRRLPAIQEVDMEGAPQDCSHDHMSADGSAAEHHLQAFAGRPGAARELVWSQPLNDMGADACGQPAPDTAAACNPAPACNRHAGANTDGDGEAAKETGAMRRGRGRGPGRAVCQSPPPKARQDTSIKVCCALYCPFNWVAYRVGLTAQQQAV